MLKVARSMRELPFEELMQVYAQTNTAVAQRRYAELSPEKGLALVENVFYEDLLCGFFSIPGAVYCLWLEENVCVSALRLEPWRDGLLVTGLETAPDRRNRGYACALLKAVQLFQGEQGAVKLYSHIDKKNTPSIHVHESCGFRRIAESAAYLDGSVNSRGATYLYEV